MKTNIAASSLEAYHNPANQANFRSQEQKIADDIIRQTKKGNGSGPTAAEIAERLHLDRSTVHARINDIKDRIKVAKVYAHDGKVYAFSCNSRSRTSKTFRRSNVRSNTYQLTEIQ